jgi:hypothetical protein
VRHQTGGSCEDRDTSGIARIDFPSIHEGSYIFSDIKSESAIPVERTKDYLNETCALIHESPG